MSSVGAPPFRRSYAMYGAIAAGGMATVHLGRLLGPSGFARRVAIKRLHPQFAADPEIASMFSEEARLAARIAHVNVVAMLDVVSANNELLLVMDYVHGESFSRLLSHARGSETPVPIAVAVTILADVLHGLHAAHEATGGDGSSLRLVHRDVSPQNIIVGTDGVARVVDFGIAKAVGQTQITRDGQVRGKIPYMAPEQLLRRSIDRRVDVYAAGVILWEALAGKRLFQADDEPTLFSIVLEEVIAPPSRYNPAVPAALDAIVLRALERDPERRFANARAMAQAVEEVVARAPSSAVADWVRANAAETLAQREARIAEMERDVRAETEAGGEAVRAPSASVFFHEAAPPPSSSSVTSAVVAASMPQLPRESTGSANMEDLTGRSSRKRRIALLGAIALFLVAGVAAPFALTRRPSAVGGGASAATTSTVEASPPLPLAVTSTAMPISPPLAAAAAPVATAPLPQVPSVSAKGPPPSRGAAGPRWCKVFDPEKQIYVMRSMRVSRCP